MKAIQLFVALLLFTTLRVLMAEENTATELPFELPTIDIPSFDFKDISGGCGGFFDCTEFLAWIIYNVAVGIIFLILLLVELLIFLFAFLALVGVLAVDPFPGAPWWISTTVSTIIITTLGMMLYKLIRRGRE